MMRPPTFRDLSLEEIDRFLTAHTYGRIAYSRKDRVDIEPIHYVFADGWIHGRTAPGTKLATLLHSPWVAFEVDEVSDLFHWTSVVVHGTVYFVDEEATESPDETRRAVVQHLRELLPETMTANDPMPDRTVLFRIWVDDVRGREARP